MPVTVTRTLYYYEDLDEKGKEKAREWYRTASAGDSFWSECVIEDAANMADILGIDLRTRRVKLMGGGTRMEPAIYWSGFWSQGDGACFEGTYKYAKGSTEKIRKEAPKDEELHKIADRLAAVQRPFWWQLVATVKHRGHYYHEHCTDIDVGLMDINFDVPKNDAFEEACEEVRDCLRAFMGWIYKSLEKEYVWFNSDEIVAENIIATEYAFDENGGIL